MCPQETSLGTSSHLVPFWSGFSGNPASIDDKVDLMEQTDAKVVGIMLGDNSKKSHQEKTRFVEVFNTQHQDDSLPTAADDLRKSLNTSVTPR